MFISRCPLVLCKRASNQLQPISVSRISTTSSALVNYYDELGIPSSSTQSDIKAAYYELSKVYHPDKNKGCQEAAQKFRAINQAYEILGNYRLRRLYDKGVLQKQGSQHRSDMRSKAAEDIEDDAQTKFYKSRFTKSKVADYTGRTPIYNFDEWARAHYGKTFDRKKTAKTKYEQNIIKKRSGKMTFQTELLLFVVCFSLLYIYVGVSTSKTDLPKDPKKVIIDD